jgi:hypothetical protein
MPDYRFMTIAVKQDIVCLSRPSIQNEGHEAVSKQRPTIGCQFKTRNGLADLSYPAIAKKDEATRHTSNIKNVQCD